MKILFIVDPLDSLKIYKDSTYTMMAEAATRGHELYVMQQEELLWKRGKVMGITRQITLRNHATPWYQLDPMLEMPLSGFDAVLMRKDPPFDMEYVTSTWLLEQAQREGARVFNDPRAVRDHNEKFAIAQFAQFTVPTVVTRSANQLQAFIDEHQDVILKPLDGMGGSQIFRARANDPNRNVIVETLLHEGMRNVMAQRYIPEIVNGDKRVLLIAGKPVPYCLARIPKEGETRGNLAAGGRGEARELTAHDRKIAEALGPELMRRGLLLVGLDVIGENLTEINVTSPTCFREIMDQTGCNVAGLMLDALEAACGKKA
jgi:glutathione synthase